MELTEARETKTQLAEFVRDLAERHGVPATPYAAGGEQTPAEVVRAPTLSLGLAPRDDGSYGIAVRYRLGVPTARSFARKLAAEVGDESVDVRRTGRIRTFADRASTRRPVATAQAAGETGRVRPLRPGVSVAHVDVTAGTLGAFVVALDQTGGGPGRYVLSNYHVLAGSPSAQVGDVVVQPGPADGGSAPADRVGTLARVVPLAPGEPATVDAALALLDDGIEADPVYPVGRITSTAQVTGREAVAKIGRTTATTAGRITAVELDGVVVGYGPELGALSFDDQIEVEGADAGPFSRGGDSGSLVYRADGVAMGLLFAGSEAGGSNGQGLTYCNPIDTVLQALEVTLG